MLRLPANGLGKTVDDDASAWAIATEGDCEEGPGSWLQLIPILAAEAICGVNQNMEDLSCALCLSLTRSNK